MSTESWTEERDRIVKLLEAIEAGTVTHVDEDDRHQLRAANDENVAVLRARLAQLNSRLEH